jgi:hypothetical protein
MGRRDGVKIKGQILPQCVQCAPADVRQMSAVAVAQLVESRIVIPVVVGSSPISHPKEFEQ